jgi:hypothetical protein
MIKKLASLPLSWVTIIKYSGIHAPTSIEHFCEEKKSQKKKSEKSLLLYITGGADYVGNSKKSILMIINGSFEGQISEIQKKS